MARVLVTLDGRSVSNGSPLLMHNERLADPLNPFALEIGKISRKRGKTEADHLEIALLEFVGGMYHDGSDDWLVKNKGAVSDLGVSFLSEAQTSDAALGPYIPGWHIVRCIQNAGKQHKLGATILRGLTPATEKAPVQYDGPREIEDLWRDGSFALRKSVGIGSSRTMRTRPVFVDWKLEVEMELDLTQMDPEKLNQLIGEAGRYQGVGDYRPLYGRFSGAAVLIGSKTKAVAKAAV